MNGKWVQLEETIKYDSSILCETFVWRQSSSGGRNNHYKFLSVEHGSQQGDGRASGEQLTSLTAKRL